MTDRILFAGHWPHLASKPLVAVPLWWLTGYFFPAWGAVAAALLLPAAYSAIRKARLWPGSLRTALAWKDEVADTWAAGIVVVPLALDGLPLTLRVVIGVVMGLVLLAGLHRWALP